MNPKVIKYIAYGVAAGLGAVAAVDIPELAEQLEFVLDGALLAAAGVLFGWSGLPRPGDAPVKKPGSKSTDAALGLLLGAMTLAGSSQSCAPRQDPCNEADMAVLVAQCRARVELECKDLPDTECPAINECDAAVDSRCGGAK